MSSTRTKQLAVVIVTSLAVACLIALAVAPVPETLGNWWLGVRPGRPVGVQDRAAEPVPQVHQPAPLLRGAALSGRVNYDDEALHVIRSRVSGELIELRQVVDDGGRQRPLRVSDRVKPADTLAVLSCKLDDKARGGARLEVAVPEDKNDPNREYTILEVNTLVHDLVDPGRALFRLGDLNRLQIWVPVPDEVAPLIRDLLQKPGTARWQIHFHHEANAAPLDLPIARMVSNLDAQQAKQILIGYLENKAGKYQVGQYLTATVLAPPPSQ